MTERCVTLEELKAMKARGESKKPECKDGPKLPDAFWDWCKLERNNGR